MFTEIAHRLPLRPTAFHAAAGVALVAVAEASAAAGMGVAGWGLALAAAALTGIKAVMIADVTTEAARLGRLPL